MAALGSFGEPVACYRPISAYQTADGSVLFSARSGADRELTLPCGACIGCRVDRAREWSLRCVHEAQLHRANCFVTLTYRPDALPPGGSLRYRDFQLFMKRLRKRLGVPVRFFVCGEYGEALSRPHYHACLFGVEFPDRRPVSYLGRPGSYRSALLDHLWGHGHCHIGELNVRSAAYAARYVLKKVTGRAAPEHYRVVDRDGCVVDRAPEFARMSLRPGIGAGWVARFSDDVWSGDYVIHEGRRFSVPKYYDRLLARTDEGKLSELKEGRELRALPFRPDGAPARLVVREEVERARLSTLKRSLEHGSDSGFGAR